MPTIYLDSCIVIYLVEKHPDYYEKLMQKIQKNAQARFVVSSLTALEVMVKPKREQDASLIARYQTFLEQFQVEGMNDQVLLEAIDYRVSGLKTPDAMHLACAKNIGCDQFWTNDTRLTKVAPNWTINVCE